MVRVYLVLNATSLLKQQRDEEARARVLLFISYLPKEPGKGKKDLAYNWCVFESVSALPFFPRPNFHLVV